MNAPTVFTELARRSGDALGRRRLASAQADLIVWREADRSLQAFQPRYGKPRQERMLGWTRDEDFRHPASDDGGMARLGHKRPSLLTAVAEPDAPYLLAPFDHPVAGLPDAIIAPIRQRLHEYAESRHE